MDPGPLLPAPLVSVLHLYQHKESISTAIMQSHASRHVASEFLKDLHPDLAPPFLKVQRPHSLSAALLHAAYSKASHDASAACGQRLCLARGLMWRVICPLAQEIVKDEISVAHGRRGIQKVTRKHPGCPQPAPGA